MIKPDKEIIADENLSFSDASKIRPLKPLRKKGDLSAANLISKIRWGNAGERSNAARLLGEISICKTPPLAVALNPLIAAMENDESASVREEAAWALWKVGIKSATLPLRRTFKSDPSIRVKARAIRSLGLLGDKSSIDLFIHQLKYGRHVPVIIKASIIAAFGSIFDKRTITYIEQSSLNADPTIRFEAAKALGRYSADPTTERESIYTLIKLSDHIRERNENIRIAAITSLRRSRSIAANKTVAKKIHSDPSANVRREALEALTIWPTNESILAASESFSDSNWSNRKTAARVLVSLLQIAKWNEPHIISDAILRGLKLFPKNSIEYKLLKSVKG